MNPWIYFTHLNIFHNSHILIITYILIYKLLCIWSLRYSCFCIFFTFFSFTNVLRSLCLLNWFVFHYHSFIDWNISCCGSTIVCQSFCHSCFRIFCYTLFTRFIIKVVHLVAFLGKTVLRLIGYDLRNDKFQL